MIAFRLILYYIYIAWII